MTERTIYAIGIGLVGGLVIFVCQLPTVLAVLMVFGFVVWALELEE